MAELRPSSDSVSSARQQGDALILTVKGEIDLHATPDLRTDLQPRVKGLLEIARLNTLFVICASESEALAK